MIITNDGSQRYARTDTREQHDPATRLGRSAPRYLDALGVAALAVLGPDFAAALAERFETALPGLISEPAWDALRGTVALLALGSDDPGRCQHQRAHRRDRRA